MFEMLTVGCSVVALTCHTHNEQIMATNESWRLDCSQRSNCWTNVCLSSDRVYRFTDMLCTVLICVQLI